MPRYDYKCPRCDKVEERTVSIAEMDEQYCIHIKYTPRQKVVTFHQMIRLPHYSDITINIPMSMRSENTLKASEIGPNSEKSEETWKREGVRRVGQRWV